VLVADASNWTAAAGTLALGLVTGVALWQTRTHARRALQPHVVPRLHADEPATGRTVALVNDGQGLARNARVALRLVGDGGQVLRSTFASLAPGESKDVELISSTDMHWADAPGCVLAKDLAGEEWVVPFTILEEHAGASPRLYVAAGRITRARHLETDTRNLVQYLQHAKLEYTSAPGPPRWRRLFRS
jgi:hypothetical protein